MIACLRIISLVAPGIYSVAPLLIDGPKNWCDPIAVVFQIQVAKVAEVAKVAKNHENDTPEKLQKTQKIATCFKLRKQNKSW